MLLEVVLGGDYGVVAVMREYMAKGKWERESVNEGEENEVSLVEDAEVIYGEWSWWAKGQWW